MADENGKLRALVVGTGFGCRIQTPALRGAGFDVVGLVGTDQARTAERAASNGVPQAFSDLGPAIAATRADVVLISTPPHTHGPLAMQAMQGGCHVLSEKPFTRDAGEARSLLAAAEKGGRVHAIGNEFRYVPHRAVMARAIAEGMIGEPRFAAVAEIGAYSARFQDDLPGWWFDPAQGGGWLGGSGSHFVDQVRYWLGEFESLSASLVTTTIIRGKVEDTYALRFRMMSGLEGTLQESSGTYGPRISFSRVVGDKATLWMDDHGTYFADGKDEYQLAIPDDLVLPPPPPLTADARHDETYWKAMAFAEIAPYTALCRRFRAAILGEPATSPVPMATFADGVAHMQVLDAIRASAKHGGALVKVADM
jgi:predicted dehydrogenase